MKEHYKKRLVHILFEMLQNRQMYVEKGKSSKFKQTNTEYMGKAAGKR